MIVTDCHQRRKTSPTSLVLFFGWKIFWIQRQYVAGRVAINPTNAASPIRRKCSLRPSSLSPHSNRHATPSRRLLSACDELSAQSVLAAVIRDQLHKGNRCLYLPVFYD